MVNNCLSYNERDTIFYRAGIKMRDAGGSILRYVGRGGGRGTLALPGTFMVNNRLLYNEWDTIFYRGGASRCGTQADPFSGM
jgi:hypothetical protein